MKSGSRLFITDLDGTLLRSDATLSEFAKTALNELLDQGLPFTFCTSRSYIAAKKILAGVRLRLPCILFNGVFMIDPLRDEILAANYLDNHTADTLLKAAREMDLSPFLFGHDREGTEKILFLPPRNEGQRRFVRNRPGDKRLQQVESLQLLEHTISLNFIDTCEALLPLKKWAEEHLGSQVRIFFAEDIYLQGYYALEFYHPAVDKGMMIQKLGNHLQIPVSRVTVFGDHLNDLSMFRVAGQRVAVSNAHPQILEMADEVIGSNDEDAVVRYLKDRWLSQ